MKKIFFMMLAVCSLTFMSCKTDNGENKAEGADSQENTEQVANGTVIECANFTVALPEGWKDTYKSDTNVNASNEEGDCTFNATYNDGGPTIDQLKTYADNLAGMKKNEGGTVDEPKIDGKVMTMKSVKDGKVTMSYATMKEDKIAVAGSFEYPEAKAAEAEKLFNTVLKSITFK